MNELAREILRQAWLDGVPQTRGNFSMGSASCALGVLGFGPDGGGSVFEVFELAPRYGLCFDRARCPVCNREEEDDVALMVHLNDDHQLDFAKIAEVMP